MKTRCASCRKEIKTAEEGRFVIETGENVCVQCSLWEYKLAPMSAKRFRELERWCAALTWLGWLLLVVGLGSFCIAFTEPPSWYLPKVWQNTILSDPMLHSYFIIASGIGLNLLAYLVRVFVAVHKTLLRIDGELSKPNT